MGEKETLNWGYLQLGLVALAFGGLQVWWISRVEAAQWLRFYLTAGAVQCSQRLLDAT